MININKIFYSLFLVFFAIHFAFASQKDELNEELSKIIKRSFQIQFHKEDSTDNWLQVAPINFDEEDAAASLALFKVTCNTPGGTDNYFVKFHPKYASNEILKKLKIVNEYFSAKQLSHVTVVRDLWSDIKDGYTFSVFSFVEAPTLDDLMGSYLTQKGSASNESSMPSQDLGLTFEKLGCAIDELHRIGLLKENIVNSEDLVSYGVHGDLHGGNIFCHPTQGIIIIDTDTYAKNINNPTVLAEDLCTIFRQSTRLFLGFVEEITIAGHVNKTIQSDITNWNLAFCTGYTKLFPENKKHIRLYLAQNAQKVMTEILSKKHEFFQDTDLKIYNDARCEEWIQEILTKIQAEIY